MRWIVVMLLVVNLAVFGWYRYAVSAPEAGNRLEAISPAGSGLKLLDVPVGDGGYDRSGLLRDGAPVVEAVRGGSVDHVEMCGMIGPFREQVSAKQVRDRIQSLGAVVDLLEIPVTLRTDYWVHMGPYPSREEAMSMLRVLQQKGVDSFLIADGALANGISLGLFRQRSSADALLAQRKAQGHDAKLREIPKVASELWVIIKEGAELADEARSQLLAVSPGTEYRKNPCGAIVSTNKFE